MTTVEISGIEYKIGRHGLPFALIQGEWVRGNRTRAMVLNEIRKKEGKGDCCSVHTGLSPDCIGYKKEIGEWCDFGDHWSKQVQPVEWGKTMCYLCQKSEKRHRKQQTEG